MRQHRARPFVPAERMMVPVNEHRYKTVVCAFVGFVIFGATPHTPSWVFLAWMVLVVLAYRSAKRRDLA